MEDKSVFISSCTRRDLARRRPGRSAVSSRLLVLVLLIVVAFVAFVLVNGGI